MSTVTPAPPADPAPAAAPPPSRDRAWREWLAVGEGLSGLLSIIAIIISFVALSSSSSGSGASSAATMTMPASTPATSAVVPAVAPQSVTMAFRSDTEHGRRGPDGTWHDAATNAVTSVRAGAKVTVTLVNYDSSPHSFTAPSLGVDQVVPGGSPSNPGQATITYTAPTEAGRYDWYCKFPCDPWAMTHVGYMKGYVTVRA